MPISLSTRGVNNTTVSDQELAANQTYGLSSLGSNASGGTTLSSDLLGTHVVRSSVTITPSSTSAKILILANAEVVQSIPSSQTGLTDTQTSADRAMIAIRRGNTTSTTLSDSTELSGSKREMFAGGLGEINGGQYPHWTVPISTQFLDTPNTTSARTYHLTTPDLTQSSSGKKIFDFGNCSIIAVEIST